MCNKVTVKNWVEAKKELDSWKAKELELRNKILQDMNTGKKIEGVDHQEWGEFKITATYKISKSVDPKALESVWKDMTEAEQSAFVYKPSLVAKNYKEVAESDLVASAVTIKPAQGSLSMKIVEEV